MSANIDRIRLESIEKRRSEVSEIVRSRKRKLSELYTVSNLSKIRTVTDEVSLKSVKDSLLSFLEKNDIQNRHSFDPDTLHFESGLEGAPSSDLIPNVSPQSNNQSSTDEVEQPTNSSTVEVQNHQAAFTKAIAGVANETVTAGVTSSSSTITDTSQSRNDEIQSSDTKQSAEKIDQKLSTSRRDTRRLKSPEARISLFDPDNKDVIDTTVLVLKEALPAKIAESTPLAELYYLSQTLPLVRLMPSTHKVVTSTMFEAALTEGKINVVHSRIEELKRQGKWSLRQPTKFDDPIKQSSKTHWDELLSEMNWMAIDFKEERKLKISTCAFIAHAISEYWKYGKVCCVKRKSIKHIEFSEIDATNDDAVSALENAESELITTNNIDISKLLERPDPSTEFIPQTLPQLTYEDFSRIREEEGKLLKVFIDLNDLNAHDKTLLDNLQTLSSFQHFDDKFDKMPLVPISKALVPIEDDTWYNVHFKQITQDKSLVPDQQKGLFGFSSQKRISTVIKPPPPPSLKYLDLRTPTIWLPEDDQNLIEYVNQFSFNWGAVSAYLSKKPTRSYSSNIERRTPWQCFERYIQLNDTFQINDMRGQNTLSAMKWLEHAHHIQATTKRRISPLGVGVESIQRGHKRLRWASMFEAMRKCMRKRESVTRPNNNIARRPVDEKKLVAPSPAELSKLKYERDKAIQEAYLQNPANGFRGRVPTGIPANRAAGTDAKGVAAPAQGLAPNQQRHSSQTQNPHTQGATQQNPGAAAPIQDHQKVDQAVTHPTSIPNSQPIHRQGTNNLPSTSVSPSIHGQARPITTQLNGKVPGSNGAYTPEQLQQLVQMRQRKAIQSQTNSTQSNPNSPSPNLGNVQVAAGNNINANSRPISRTNGNPSSASNQPAVVTNQTSTNATNNNGRKLAFVPAHVSAIINQIQTQNPNMSKQDVTKIAAQYLASLQAKNRANNNGVNSNNQSPGLSQNRAPNSSASPLKPNAVPTPHQILQQQQHQQPKQALAPQRQQPQLSPTLSQGGGVHSPQIQQQTGAHPSTLTPQQTSQLDMLKALHAEQQHKRQQEFSSQQGSTLSSPNNTANNSSQQSPQPKSSPNN